MYDKFASKKAVVLFVVSEHQGIEDNENADKLARDVALSPLNGPGPVCEISKAVARVTAKRRVSNNHIT